MPQSAPVMSSRPSCPIAVSERDFCSVRSRCKVCMTTPNLSFYKHEDCRNTWRKTLGSLPGSSRRGRSRLHVGDAPAIRAGRLFQSRAWQACTMMNPMFAFRPHKRYHCEVVVVAFARVAHVARASRLSSRSCRTITRGCGVVVQSLHQHSFLLEFMSVEDMKRQM